MQLRSEGLFIGAFVLRMHPNMGMLTIGNGCSLQRPNSYLFIQRLSNGFCVRKLPSPLPSKQGACSSRAQLARSEYGSAVPAGSNEDGRLT